jgi:hypothetical protein
MGRIVISENVTLDGVVQDPTGDEGSRIGGWFDPRVAEDADAWASVMFEEATHAQALLSVDEATSGSRHGGRRALGTGQTE